MKDPGVIFQILAVILLALMAYFELVNDREERDVAAKMAEKGLVKVPIMDMEGDIAGYNWVKVRPAESVNIDKKDK